MLTKHDLNQLKSARSPIVKTYKKRIFEASLVVKSQSKIKDNKISIADTNNMKGKFET